VGRRRRRRLPLPYVRPIAQGGRRASFEISAAGLDLVSVLCTCGHGGRESVVHATELSVHLSTKLVSSYESGRVDAISEEQPSETTLRIAERVRWVVGEGHQDIT
jgi:hypothetical protein